MKRRPPNAGKGRPKGVPNKSTAVVKEAILYAYGHLKYAVTPEKEVTGPAALAAWASDHPTDFYTKVLPRLLPTELQHSGDPEKPVTLEVVFRNEASR